jgi:hypothetical protein
MTDDPPGLSDDQLLRQCAVDTYRASGPGGQHRNKTDSAVRLRHLPTGVSVIAEESRSRHDNKATAVRRLRAAIAMEVRTPVDRLHFHAPDWFRAALNKAGRLKLGRRDGRYWPCAALLLDVLAACEGRMSDSAGLLGITTGNLSGFLTSDPQLMAAANRIRDRFALGRLRV